MEIALPEKVSRIIGEIQKAGYEAYAVGGCIRDSMLGRKPNDWDITTSASPEKVKELFPRTIDTGIAHGTVTVMMGKEGFEVTTYRIDGVYEDNRHPREVTFTGDLTEDLKRRDFTINAMAYNHQRGLVDVFGGIEDMEKKLIRCVGDAGQRFSEDALRMMRAIRFSAQLGYEIEETTREAIGRMAPSLRKISGERIQAELVKLLVSPHPDYLKTAWETGITREILPEFDRCMETGQNNPHHCYTVGEHTLAALREIRGDRVLRLTMLFHDFGKPDKKTVSEDGCDHFYGHQERSAEMARQILTRLKFDNETIRQVTKLVYYHDWEIAASPSAVRRALNRMGEDLFPLLLEVKRSDMMAQSPYSREIKEEHLNRVGELYREIKENKDCITLKDLAVSGKDLIDLGMKPGAELGDTLKKLLELVLEYPDRNTKEGLLRTAASLKNQHDF